MKERWSDVPNCSDVVDYVEHLFFDSLMIQKFLNSIEQNILINYFRPI